MQRISLAAVPNQSFSVVLDSNAWDLTIKTAGNIMTATISFNNILLVSNARIVAGYPLLNYTSLENGNFIITTLNGVYPFYTQFGISQFLLYASQAEIDAFRAAA